MKSKELSLKLLVLVCMLLWPAIGTRAQRAVAHNNLVKCSVETEAGAWSKGKPAFVSVRIENVSGRDLKFWAMYLFNLHSQSKESLKRKYEVVGDTFWAPAGIISRNGDLVMVPNGSQDTIWIDRTHGRPPNEEVNLKAGATLQFKVDLAQFHWEDRMHSVWPNQEFFKEAHPGKYLLSLEIDGDEVKASSNSVEVNIL